MTNTSFFGQFMAAGNRACHRRRQEKWPVRTLESGGAEIELFSVRTIFQHNALIQQAWRPRMNKPILVGLVLAIFALPLPAFADSEKPKTTSTTAYSTEDELKEKYGDLGTTYTAAVALIDAGQYQEAVIMLDSLGKADDPRVLNYLGFSHRKLGKVDDAVAYYEKALKVEPHFAAAHEYLGEAYIDAGKVDKANEQLDKIKAICGTGCAEYVKLEAAITAHKAKS